MGRECKPYGFLLGKKKKKIYIYDCAGSSLLRVFPAADSGGYSLVVVLHCGGFPWGAQALGHTGFSGCGERAQ